MARHTKILILGLIAILAIGAISYSRKGVAEDSTAVTKPEQSEQTEIEQLYKEARARFCLLTARPAEEREQAVANIREFLGMPTVDVDFVCSQFEDHLDYTAIKGEYYTAAGFGLTVEVLTNSIIKLDAAELRWGRNEDGTRWNDPAPEYDYSGRYSQAEAQEVAEKFFVDHKNIVGFDIENMSLDLELTGEKPGNYFFTWRNKEGTASVTITNGGQIIVYTNAVGRQPSR